MKQTITSFIFLLTLISNYAQTSTSEFFNSCDQFFSAHVANGLVDYTEIKKDQSQLDDLLMMLEKLQPNDPSDTAKAIWINSYNLFVIKGIIDNYPLSSPLKVADFFDKELYTVGEKKYSLNAIENKVLRPIYKDARLHFVLVCGALGCPPLINQAYLPETLEAQLTSQTSMAINGTFIQAGKKNKIQVSEIMKWYKEDFVSSTTSEIDFINTYATEKYSANTKISYFAYNWNVNKQ